MKGFAILSKIYHKINYISRTIIVNCSLVILAIFKKADTKYILICYPLGDTCYGLAFSDSLQSKYKCKYVICNNHKELVINCYPRINIKDVFFYEKKSILNDLVLYCNFHSYINRIYGKYNILATTPYAYYKSTDYITESYLNYLRGVFNLDKNALPTRPYHKYKESMIKGKIAILNPYSNSMEVDNIEYWQTLVNYLNLNGYTVYTNVINKQRVIEGSLPLNCSIFDLYSIVNENNALVVSIRSGIIDFLIDSNAFFLIIYYSDERIPSRSLKNFCNLTKWEHGKKNVVELMSTDTNLREKTISCINNYI